MTQWTRRATLAAMGAVGANLIGPAAGRAAQNGANDSAPADGKPLRIDMLTYGSSTDANLYTSALDGGLESAVLDIVGYPRIPETAEKELHSLSTFAAAPDAPLRIVRKSADFSAARASGRFAGVLASQDASILGFASEDFEARLRRYYNLGLRLLQLTHNNRTPFGESYMEPRDGGLSQAGRSLISLMNELGMLIDVSHCSRLTLLDAVEASGSPCLVTHAGAHALAPTKRNKSDEEIRAIAASGGVFGVFGLTLWLTQEDRADIDTVLDHLVYAAELVGPEHVGFGSDGLLLGSNPDEERTNMARVQEANAGGPSFEWPVRHTRAPGANGVDRMEKLAEGLHRRGFSSAEADAVTGGNFLRVFRNVVG